VIAGTGAVEMLTLRDGFVRVPLRAGSAIEYGPGVVHRLVNGGGLELLVIMQNGGLPELGDVVWTFPTEILQDASRYTALARTDDSSEVLARRDCAVEGFLELKQAFARSSEEGRRLLAHFYGIAVRRVGARVERWARHVAAGAGAAHLATLSRIEALRVRDPSYLGGGAFQRLEGAGSADTSEPGMCGNRWPFAPSPRTDATDVGARGLSRV
jgi:hypothetical protein